MKDVSDVDVFYMKKAIELARKAESLDEVPVGAVAVVNNEVIGEGFNCPISTNNPTSHAEIIALRKTSQKLNNYRLPEVTLYVTLEPCVMCIGAIINARIKRLIFGAFDPKFGAVSSGYKILNEGRLNHKIEFQGGILASECGKILSDFFYNKRQIVKN